MCRKKNLICLFLLSVVDLQRIFKRMPCGGNMSIYKRKKWIQRILLITVLALSVLFLAAVVYWNSMLGLLTRPEEIQSTAPHQETAAEISAPAETIPETTSPEETWPEVISDKAVTNIMLVGQNWREDEPNKLSDTMILCSINRNTRTMTMISILRDLYIDLPAYAGHGPGRNRINVCYALGSSWTGTSQGGMEMLAKCVEQNFGVHVDHTVEVGFDAFSAIIDALGGVKIDVSQEEAAYMTEKVGYIGAVEPGVQTLDGMEALAYARIRKIDSDRQRSVRQRTVISSLLEKCRDLSLIELHRMASAVFPYIITDMTNEEITNYVWEFLPMVKDLQLASVTIPVDNETLPGSMWHKTIDLYGYPSDVVQCNVKLNRNYLLALLLGKGEEKIPAGRFQNRSCNPVESMIK